jgi:hypothetical protein
MTIRTVAIKHLLIEEGYMARYKKELARIHSKKVKKAKIKIKLFRKGEITEDKLTSLAKKFLRKSKKFSAKSA